MLTSTPDAPSLTRVSDGRPEVLLLSPLLTDARVWSGFAEALGHRAGVVICVWPGHGFPGADLPTSLDPLASAMLSTKELNDPVVVAVGRDAAVAVHLARSGRARALVLIRPEFVALPSDFVVADHEIRPPADEFIEALTDAIGSGDPAAFGAAQVAPEADRLPAGVQPSLQVMYADNWHVLMAGADWATYPPSWQDDLARVTMPVLVIAPSTEADDPLPTRLGKFFSGLAPAGRLATVSSDSEYPWLAAQEEVLRLVSDFLGELADR